MGLVEHPEISYILYGLPVCVCVCVCVHACVCMCVCVCVCVWGGGGGGVLENTQTMALTCTTIRTHLCDHFIRCPQFVRTPLYMYLYIVQKLLKYTYIITASTKPQYWLSYPNLVGTTHILRCALIGAPFYTQIQLLHIYREKRDSVHVPPPNTTMTKAYLMVLPTCLINSLYLASFSVEKAAPSRRIRQVPNANKRRTL